MKLLLMILPFLTMSVAYDDVNDNQLQQLVKNKEAFRLYLGCFVDLNPCDELAAHTKTHITESLTDGCEECDEAQKHLAHSLIQAMKTDFPDIYEAFEDRYDPDRTLLAKLDEKMKKKYSMRR